MKFLLPRFNKNWIHYVRTAVCIAVLYWIGCFQYDNSTFKYIVQLSCLCAFFLICSSFFEKNSCLAISLTQLRKTSRHADKFWCFFGLIITIIILSALEWIQPYYFIQDDTHSASFPIILQGMRGLFHEGVFPTWNPYQFLGMPTTTLGYFSLTYPITYLSYLLSLGLFRHELATMDIFAWIHLLGGYVIGYAMLRELHIRPSLAVAASLCCSLCIFNVWFGHHNNLFIPQALWAPALGWSLVCFAKGKITFRWVAWTAFSIGFFFHSGNIQMWFYGVALWGMGIIWVALFKPGAWWRHLLLPISSGLIGMAIAAPLLVVEAIEVNGIYRGSDSWIRFDFGNFLLPWFSVAQRSENQMYWYSGSIFIFAFFLKAAFDIAYIGSKNFNKHFADTSCFTFLSIIAFTMALGSQGPLWDWLAQYPPFSRIRHAYKFTPYVIFFMTVSGVILIEFIARNILHGRQVAYGLAIVAVGLIAHQNYINTKYPIRWLDTPYPPAWPEQAVLQTDEFSTKGRVVAYWKLWAGSYVGFPQTLADDYATIYKIPSVWGWSNNSIESILPEVSRLHREWNNRFHFYQEYGVQWVVLSKIPPSQNYQDISASEVDSIKKAATYQIIPEHNSSPQKKPGYVIEMYRIGNADTKPMAYVRDMPSVPLDYKLLANGIDIKIPYISNDAHVELVANFLYRHWFKAYTNSENDLIVKPDNMGRILVDLTKPAHILSIRYSPPWHYGFLLGGVFLLFAWLMYMLMQYLNRMKALLAAK
jgi:hypothetical protein